MVNQKIFYEHNLETTPSFLESFLEISSLDKSNQFLDMSLVWYADFQFSTLGSLNVYLEFYWI